MIAGSVAGIGKSQQLWVYCGEGNAQSSKGEQDNEQSLFQMCVYTNLKKKKKQVKKK